MITEWSWRVMISLVGILYREVERKLCGDMCAEALDTLSVKLLNSKAEIARKSGNIERWTSG